MVALGRNMTMPVHSGGSGRPEPAIRLADIARQAGVSEATVSRVLNGKAGVASGTRRCVLAAMDLLGYERPARTRQNSNGLVGLITPELDNPIFPAFAQAIERTLTQHGYTPVLCTQEPGGATEDEFVQALVDRGVAGIVFVSGRHADTTAAQDRYVRLVQRATPIVLIDGYAAEVLAPFFSPDDRAAARLAVSHLIALGHNRIGLAIGPERFVPAGRKAEGFRAAMASKMDTDEVENLIVSTLYSVEGGRAAAEELLDRECTAVFCASDLMALGAIRAARKRGLRVPEDFSVVGFDDSPLMAFTDPPLTTIRKPVAAIAAAAVRTLLDRIRGKDCPVGEFVFDPELIVRGSTAACPAR